MPGDQVPKSSGLEMLSLSNVFGCSQFIMGLDYFPLTSSSLSWSCITLSWNLEGSSYETPGLLPVPSFCLSGGCHVVGSQSQLIGILKLADWSGTWSRLHHHEKDTPGVVYAMVSPVFWKGRPKDQSPTPDQPGFIIRPIVKEGGWGGQWSRLSRIQVPPPNSMTWVQFPKPT